MMEKEGIQIHFFEFKAPYQFLKDRKSVIHPNGKLDTKPWAQMEFSILDPVNN